MSEPDKNDSLGPDRGRIPPPPPPSAKAEGERASVPDPDAEEGLDAGDEEVQDIKEILREEVGELQQDVVEIAARDVERSDQNEARLAREKANKKEKFYSNLIYTITNLRYEEHEARVLWVNMLAHKLEMSDRLDRNVGIRVAALDYFRNILGALDEVKIMDASRYIETAQLAVTDGLTGVFNHRYFQDRLLRDINRASEEDGCLSLLMIDIDNFKQYNDINGHIAGDVALTEVASVLRRNLKRDDLVARYGGEEFAVILVDLDRASAQAVAERIRQRMVERDFPNEKVLPGRKLTISIGLAEFPNDAYYRSELIAAADRALYLAKNSGKNKVVCAPKDQRMEVRQPLSLNVSFLLSSEDAQAERHESHSLNLSLNGLCMYTSRQLVIGNVLNLEMEGFPQGEQVVGRVMWIKPHPNGENQIGIKFVKIGPKQRNHIKTMLGNVNL